MSRKKKAAKPKKQRSASMEGATRKNRSQQSLTRQHVGDQAEKLGREDQPNDNEAPTIPETTSDPHETSTKTRDSGKKAGAAARLHTGFPRHRERPHGPCMDAMVRAQTNTTVASRTQDQAPCPAPHILIYESELKSVGALSAAKARLETGGAIYGTWTHSGRAVVGFVTGPGPEAVHERAHFVQDIEFFRTNTEFLYEDYGIQFIGPWHSHHELGLDRPSGGDAEQIRSIGVRNNFSRLVEIVTTHRRHGRAAIGLARPSARRQSTLGSLRWPCLRSRGISSQHDGVFVKINSFEHTAPQSGQCRRCSIRVLPGLSPYRLALTQNGQPDHTGLARHDFDFPLERILFDALEETPGEAEDLHRTPTIPQELVEQCDELSEAVINGMTVTVSEGLFIFELSTLSHATVLLAYDDQAPYIAKAVGFQPAGDDKKLLDVTAHALADRPRRSMAQIYARMAGFDPGLSDRAVEAELSVTSQASAKARTLLERAQEAAEPHNGLDLPQEKR